MTFDTALLFSMKYEVGHHFDSTDPEVIAGLCSTKEQKHKVGYVNDPADSGGETKFGIAKNANPTINIRGLGWPGAKMIYSTKYWGPIKGNDLPDKLGICVFDAAVNHGTKRAIVFLQRALGLIEDGILGPATMAKIKAIDEKTIITKYLAIRQKFYNDIVTGNPSQSKFLKGWVTRVMELERYIA